MSIDRSTVENVASNPSPEQQGWTERPMDEIRDMGPDVWDQSMGNTDAGGENVSSEQVS